jgi:hypothetical protein
MSFHSLSSFDSSVRLDLDTNVVYVPIVFDWQPNDQNSTGSNAVAQYESIHVDVSHMESQHHEASNGSPNRIVVYHVVLEYVFVR